MDISSIAQQLEGAHRDKDGWRAKCPVHDGKSDNSLSIREQNGQIFVHCFSGCSWEAIRSYLNLDPPERSPQNRIETIYSYHDENGILLYQSVRTTNPRKKWFQRKPHPSEPGKFINSIKGVSLILYRVQEVKAAMSANLPIFIVEGEKDVETLRHHGRIATTNAMGAGKWQDSYSETLKGADVVLIPDNDKPGKDHADTVTAKLTGYVKSLRRLDLPDLPDKGDISDYLTNHTIQELDALIAPLPTILEAPHLVSTPYSEIEPQDIDWLWEPYIALGRLTLLEGDPGNGKTFLSLALASALSKGHPLPGQDGKMVPLPVDPSCTLLIGEEDDPNDTIRPRLDTMDGDLTKIHQLNGWQAGPTIEYFTFQQLQLLAEDIRFKGTKLVVIDPVDAFLGANVDMHRTNEVKPLLTQLARIARETNCAFLLVRHWNKSGTGSARMRGLGSVAFTGVARSQIVVGESFDDENLRIMAHSKYNTTAKGVSQVFELKGGQFKWAGISEIDADTLAKGQHTKRERQRNSTDEWLYDRLRGQGRVASIQIYAESRAVGIADRTLRASADRLQVVKETVSGTHFWSLPSTYNNNDIEGDGDMSF